MAFLDLRIGTMIQGEFEPSQLNVVLAFQVNCPGCLSHAIPLAVELYQRYQDQGAQVLGLSTAFEDFNFNTEENTRKLIEEGDLVGETAKYFQRMGMERYHQSIPFPVAMDSIGLGGVGETFENNRFRGTPTWVLWDAALQIKATWFGHKEKHEVIQMIDALVPHPPSHPF